MHRLPPELREQVYKEVFDGGEEEPARGAAASAGSTLLQALGPDPELYGEALRVYVRKTTLLLDKDNIGDFERQFPRERTGMIERLRLEIDIEDQTRSTAPEATTPDAAQLSLHRILDAFISSPQASPSAPRLARLTALRSLTVQFQVRPVDSKLMLAKFDRALVFIERCVEVFAGLERLSVVLLVAGATGFASNFWDRVNVLLGKGRLVRGYERADVRTENRYGRTDEWVWEGSVRKIGEGNRPGRGGAWA